MTEAQIYDPEADAIYLYNQLKEVDEDQRESIVLGELEKSNSMHAATTIQPSELVYLRKVWLLVLDKLQADKLKSKTQVPQRNVRETMRFE